MRPQPDAAEAAEEGQPSRPLAPTALFPRERGRRPSPGNALTIDPTNFVDDHHWVDNGDHATDALRIEVYTERGVQTK